MADFRCKSLHTIYATENKTIDWSKEMNYAACFGESLNMMGRNPGKEYTASYHIMLMTDPSYMNNTNGNNYCIFDSKFVYCYLRRINRVKAFKFNVEDSEYHGYRAYKINLTMTGTRAEFTFVLQSIKRLYEHPYCFYLSEAKRMQENSKFKFNSLFNLYNAVTSYFQGSTCNTDHSYSGSSIAVPVRVIRERLAKANFATDVYTPKVLRTHHIIPLDTDSWTYEEFKKRLPGYVKNLKDLSK